MNELKSKIGILDTDSDVPNADYPEETVSNGLEENSENKENGVDDSDTDTLHGEDTADNTEEISKIAKGESSYLSMFGATNGSKQEEDDTDAPQVSVMTPGGSSYFSLFDTEGKPLDVVMMSADDISDIKEEITE